MEEEEAEEEEDRFIVPSTWLKNESKKYDTGFPRFVCVCMYIYTQLIHKTNWPQLHLLGRHL